MWIVTAFVVDKNNVKYDNQYFIDDYDKIYDVNWQIIYEQMRTHLEPYDTIEFGYGGDDQDGTVVLQENVRIPDMKFFILEKEYTMKFRKPFLYEE